MNTKKFILYVVLDCAMLVSVCNSFAEVEDTFEIKGTKCLGLKKYLKDNGISKVHVNYSKRFESSLDMEMRIARRNCEM